MSRFLSAGIATVLLAAASIAAGQQVINIHAGDVSGKITEIGPAGIVVRTLTNTSVLCLLDPERREGPIKIPGMGPIQIEVNGATTVDALQKGMVVRYLVELDMRMQVGEVSEVTVLGYVFPADAPAGMTPEGGNLGGEENGKKAPPPISGKFLVLGQIENARGGFINVEFPGGKQRAKLAATATVNVHANDLGFARVGDSIRVEGRYVVPARMHVGKATITLAARDEKKPPVRPAVGPRAAPNKKGEDGPGNFAPGDPRPEAAPAAPAEAAKPKTKGKIVKVN